MHLTVRMAWHDNEWNGKVCCDPASNNYCTGAHSLLSGRIEKKKNTELEQSEGVRGEYVAKNFSPANVPPCYWSINAFGDQDIPVEHQHAFDSITQTVPELLRKYSVMTWPFKLSFVHNEENQKRYGNYWPDLDQRIDNYIQKFIPKKSIIFFYANYDNPVSGDEMKYLVIGCSVISHLPVKQYYKFTAEELAKWRKPKYNKNEGTWDTRMQNFPDMNWMLQFSHDPESAVLLPYHEYLSYIKQHPDATGFLDDIKVVADEASLVKGFKYVSMDIDDDKCLYLLYKLRRSILKAQEHNQAVVKRDFKKEEQKLDKLIAGIWEKRGIYPSLKHVLNYFLDDPLKSNELAAIIQTQLSGENHLLRFFQDVAEETIPGHLKPFIDDLLDLAENRQFRSYTKALAKLSLFALTGHQVAKIIDQKDLLKAVGDNPYILYEQYLAEEDDLDIPDMQDEPIDVFKIDMGMIPDRKFVQRHRVLQNLTEDSPQRLRSVIINYLGEVSSAGHCYSSAEEVLANLYEYPLIYKNSITLDDTAILALDDDYQTHFLEKLAIEESKKAKFVYLKTVRNAELQVEQIIDDLISRPMQTRGSIDIEKHIAESLEKLRPIVTTEEQKEQFRSERRQLYQNILEKSFYILTGRPGAGKTYETSMVIDRLVALNEEVLVLAPTGKAALRLTENIRKHTSLEHIQAQTIDTYIFQNKFGWLYDDWDECFELPADQKILVDNLIIDESSMLDLKKLSILFAIIRFDEHYPKRLILVGDENQLPPIGLGKPFHDLITFIKSKHHLTTDHYIHLLSNCRQRNDEKILEFAEAFAEKTRGYEGVFNLIEDGEGQKSKGLYVYQWQNEEVLYDKMINAAEQVFELESEGEVAEEDFVKLNRVFGLYDNGRVNNQGYNFRENLDLESLQILTPYRTDFYGTVGINRLVQNRYRESDERENFEKIFHNGDKIIRLENWYRGWGERRKLVLSNGSMGVVNLKFTKIYDWWKEQRIYYFKDVEKVLYSVDDEENFDLAYAITVHKSQGSDFENVFMVIPKKGALLNKELLYTALTRSRFRLFIFIQESSDSLLLKAKNTSQLLLRRTSIFKHPELKVGKFSPEPGVTVSSKVEFIIYQALLSSGLKFKYEQPLAMENLSYKIHPDFTINLANGITIYWEHLGMLDVRRYWNDWQERKNEFIKDGKFDYLVTTDDLEGIDMRKLEQVITDIKHQSLNTTRESKYSQHHYSLH